MVFVEVEYLNENIEKVWSIAEPHTYIYVS